SVSLAEAITSITIEAQSNRNLDLTTADAVLSAVSDSLELGLWIAEFLPDQVTAIAAEQMTGPGGMDWRTTGTLFAELRQFAETPSPMFRDSAQPNADSVWNNACGAIAEMQRVYTI